MHEGKMRTRGPGARYQHGFTMLEMVIVLMMISIVAMISLGRVSEMMTSWRVIRASQAFAEELQSGFALVGRNPSPSPMTRHAWSCVSWTAPVSYTAADRSARHPSIT
jgi:prepilin-type N-terminal cleavage/methylation domain-containing protein